MDQFHNKLGQVFSRLPTFSGGKNKTEDGKPEKVTSDRGGNIASRTKHRG
ncbi:hypothetical protein Hanom_Chr16g01477611 [Helianthus anomalus]